LLTTAVVGLLTGVGCARVALEGGEKPIHIVMDVNVKVDRELNEFFAFEKKYDAQGTTQPATPPTTNPASQG
jgi:hypothetical protein